jgi:hypothetical protein
LPGKADEFDREYGVFVVGEFYPSDKRAVEGVHPQPFFLDGDTAANNGRYVIYTTPNGYL